MAVNGKMALAVAKKYVEETANQLGSLKGAPCTIQSIVEVDNVSTVTFSWTGADSTTQTQALTIKSGKDGVDGKDGTDGVGISSIAKTGSIGNVDTYTIAMSDGTTSEFTVTNASQVSKISELQNDKGYIDKDADDLTNYYKKDDVYNKDEVAELHKNLTAGLTVQIVDTLPDTNISVTTIYLIKDADTNVYTQYMYIASSWAVLGSTEIDLSDYDTSEQVDAKLADYVKENALTTLLSSYVKSVDLSAVAKSNSYNDLDNLPTIPTVSNDLTDELKAKYDTVTDKAPVGYVGQYDYDMCCLLDWLTTHNITDYFYISDKGGDVIRCNNRGFTTVEGLKFLFMAARNSPKADGSVKVSSYLYYTKDNTAGTSYITDITAYGAPNGENVQWVTLYDVVRYSSRVVRTPYHMGASWTGSQDFPTSITSADGTVTTIRKNYSGVPNNVIQVIADLVFEQDKTLEQIQALVGNGYKICTTTIENASGTATLDDGVTGSATYDIVNGVCFVNLKDISASTTISGLPKAAIAVSFGGMNGYGSMDANATDATLTGSGDGAVYASFSYPVAE